jgi:radical SAM protein (TIGR01212 family)
MTKIYPWGDSRRYNSYSRYFRELFGERIQKVAVNGGFTCPNRDGSISVGGCSFCNSAAFSPSYCTPEKSIAQQVAEGIEFHRRRYPKAERYLAYFQTHSNTYAPLDKLKRLYEEALSCEGIIGLVIGTRPDCVDEQKLDYIASLAQQCYVSVEYGIESCYDSTLATINRGHDFECARKAVEMTHSRGIHTGAHFIIGLPGETHQMIIDQTDIINTLPLDSIKFHQLQIFSGTLMEREYERAPERFHFPTMEEYIDLFAEILVRLRADIVVERFAGEAPPRYHRAGCDWGLVRNERLWQLLEKRLVENDLWQGAKCRFER